MAEAPKCPDCGSSDVEIISTDPNGGATCRCNACGVHFEASSES